jgi:hypothetical protein
VRHAPAPELQSASLSSSPSAPLSASLSAPLSAPLSAQQAAPLLLGGVRSGGVRAAALVRACVCAFSLADRRSARGATSSPSLSSLLLAVLHWSSSSLSSTASLPRTLLSSGDRVFFTRTTCVLKS